ncbi:MAG: hypothetical protein AVDCRST_MAG70-2053 [uncultured Thermomicrobiales bacterium]|uniref:Uncharacterized protein n=1 Tax=uncultured Thermomicrobiales bacterium TaxID=1645740 RepID=A0A6J4V5Q9_9BACT|nr:MAG: hypothetical protein AVDCRST_MAG70-2053 [uncultured Thermomicrobiales bacterium]
MKNRITTLFAVGAMALAVGVGSASAHYCTPVNKADGAGSVGTYNIATGQFTPSKRLMSGFNMDTGRVNGAFVTFTDGSFSYDLFMHQLLPDGALAAGPGGDDQCDGQGVDDALSCLGIPH